MGDANTVLLLAGLHKSRETCNFELLFDVEGGLFLGKKMGSAFGFVNGICLVVDVKVCYVCGLKITRTSTGKGWGFMSEMPFRLARPRT